jgi:hypothetical protein
LHANETEIATKLVTVQVSGTATVDFTWNTSSFAKGNYTISAYATPVQNEVNIADNLFTDGVVRVVIPGDVNGDGIVDVFDAVLLAGAAGTNPTSPNWNPNADINNDLIIDVFDAVILAGHAGEHYS